MRVLIPALSSASRPDGVTRHAINLARCLLHRPEIDQVDVVCGKWQQNFFESLLGGESRRLRLHVPPTGSTMFARNLWFERHLSALAVKLRSDLMHVAYPVPLGQTRMACPVVVTLHDLYPYDVPENFGFPRVFVNRFILERCLSAADAIACVSRSTQTRLKEHRPELSSKTVAIPNTVDTQPPGPDAPLPWLDRTRFLLSVAQHRRNKNIPLALTAFHAILKRHPELLLVLVGNKGPETASLQTLLADGALHNRVVVLHGITDPELQWCYRHCELLLATSTHEGFGLPVAEAMLAGCPVVCTDIAPFRELAGDYACYAAPHASSLSEGMESTLARQRPSPAALPQLSADVIAAQCLRLYQHLLTPKTAWASAYNWTSQKGGAA